MKRIGLRSALLVATAVGLLLVPGCLADKRTLTLGDGRGGDGGVDGPLNVAPGPCDPPKQTGCDDGLKCAIDIDTGATYCTADGTMPTRSGCSFDPDDCVAGNVCLGVCRQLCERNDDCKQPPPAGQPTNEAICAFEVPNSRYRVCSTPCNPVPRVGPSGCPAGIACSYGNLNGILITDCNRLRGTGRDGATCSTQEDCADGYYCTTTNRCRAFCRNGFDDDCLASDVCTPASSGMFGLCCPASATDC